MNKQTRIRLILIVTALLIVVLVLIRLVFITKSVGDSKIEPPNTETVEGERITRAESIRLLSYLFYSKSEREALNDVIQYGDAGTGEWYDSYLNAAVNAGLIDGGLTMIRPLDNLTCGELRDMLLFVTRAKGIAFSEILTRLPARLRGVKVKDECLHSEFLTLYEELLDVIDDSKVERTSMFVLNVVESARSDKELQFVNEENRKLYLGHFMDYTDAVKEPNPFDYLDTTISVLICGSEIVYITDVSYEPVLLPNVFVNYAEKNEVNAFVNGQKRTFSTVQKLSETVNEAVADITISDRHVSGITVKPDRITGKVLMTDSERIEVDGFGVLEFDDIYRIYKLYDEIEMERTNSILVGYDNVEFVVADGKVCAVLIREEILAKNIRVLISVDRTTNYYHDKVSFTADCPFTVTQGEEVTGYEAGDVLTVLFDDFMPDSQRIRVETLTENGRIKLTSINRSYGKPYYHGVIEIAAAEKGLLIVNDVSIEEYLYSVVPSEMPTGHGEEALKVQAVCARSYAYMQLLANRYASYGAHIDDTVNCQVYNNVAENVSSIFAVKDTYGKVMTYNGKIVTAYYFSTSSGFTSSIEDVWGEVKPQPFFTGTLQLDESSRIELAEAISEVRGRNTTVEETDMLIDLSEEETFRSFIDGSVLTFDFGTAVLHERVDTLDSGFSWYRWNVTLTGEELGNQMDATIAKRYKVNPACILTMEKKTGYYTTPAGKKLTGTFSEIPITTVGTVKKIEVISRARSGLITELLVTGSKNTVLICNQTNVRTLLAPVAKTVYLSNNVTIDGFDLMPSAFFYVESEGAHETIPVFTFYGGGYGHGVGMSQNGVKSLAARGYDYEHILQHYYRGIEMGFIYER